MGTVNNSFRNSPTASASSEKNRVHAGNDCLNQNAQNILKIIIVHILSRSHFTSCLGQDDSDVKHQAYDRFLLNFYVK